MNKNVLTEVNQAINNAIDVLETSLIGSVFNADGEPMSKEEVIEVVIDILRGGEYDLEEMTQEGGE